MKRLFFRLFCVCCGVAALCLVYGFFVEPRGLKLREVTVVSPRHTGSPLRIALISDIHIGGYHVPAERVERLVAMINDQAPDIVLIPGDFINGHTPRTETPAAFQAEVEAGLDHLAGLTAPVFATIGNHDAWYDADYVSATLTKRGVNVLDNAAIRQDGMCIVGLADAYTDEPDRASYADCAAGDTVLTLTHSPDAFRDFRGDTALAVAGHTHGGQINLPLLGRRVNASDVGIEHSYGLSRLGGVPIFITAGVGTSILPARFRAPPEIVIITLTAQPD